MRLIGTILIVSVGLIAFAQETSWVKVAPVSEEFTVLLPKPASKSHRDVPFDENYTVVTPLYDTHSDGVRYMVLSFEKGPEPRPVKFRGFDDFVSGIQYAILHSVRGQHNSMSRERDLKQNGFRARQYGIRMGEYPGVVRVYETKRRFYVAMLLGGVASNEFVDRFLDSFQLSSANSDETLSGVSNETATSSPSSTPQNPWPVYVRLRRDLPVAGGVLNGKAIEKPAPSYPREALTERASGVVTVRVLVNEEGTVESATVFSGHPLLHKAAVEAALRARFKPMSVMGEPVKLSGVLTYKFDLP